MNERIRELAEQAELHLELQSLKVEKFAELIVKECAESLWTEECYNSDLALEEFERNSAKIKQHFGVEE
jgi:hypothetical protein